MDRNNSTNMSKSTRENFSGLKSINSSKLEKPIKKTQRNIDYIKSELQDQALPQQKSKILKPIYDGRKLETMRGVDVSEIKHYVKGTYRNRHDHYTRPSSLNLFPVIGMTNNKEVYTTSHQDAEKQYADGLKVLE